MAAKRLQDGKSGSQRAQSEHEHEHEFVRGRTITARLPHFCKIHARVTIDVLYCISICFVIDIKVFCSVYLQSCDFQCCCCCSVLRAFPPDQCIPKRKNHSLAIRNRVAGMRSHVRSIPGLVRLKPWTETPSHTPKRRTRKPHSNTHLHHKRSAVYCRPGGFSPFMPVLMLRLPPRASSEAGNDRDGLPSPEVLPPAFSGADMVCEPGDFESAERMLRPLTPWKSFLY
jgi:hypothetical protein